METIAAKVETVAQAVDSRITVTICGSFRRGLQSSGDIDIHITHPDYKLPAKPTSALNPLKLLCEALVRDGQ
jgi:DNA polymerase/3'-5' exonuclease PolX